MCEEIKFGTNVYMELNVEYCVYVSLPQPVFHHSQYSTGHTPPQPLSVGSRHTVLLVTSPGIPIGS